VGLTLLPGGGRTMVRRARSGQTPKYWAPGVYGLCNPAQLAPCLVVQITEE
jgi:hypothetical protein